jgi:protein-S-isoprenylcysteine O-methyltransferase Ste14
LTASTEEPGSEGRPLAANLGSARPPIIYLAAIVLGWALDVAFPLSFLGGGGWAEAGAVVVALAVLLFVSSLRRFRVAGTSVRGNEPTTTIVRTGPYRFTRNPIYLAFTVLQLGLAMWTDNPWMLLTLLPAFGLMERVVVPREERYLEAKFGAEYLDYKRSVRRWV